MKIAACSLNGRSGHEAGRALLAFLYRQETGQDLPILAIAPGGKPYLPDSDLHFSITHTPEHAMCVLARHPVGIDAEECCRNVSPNVVRRVLSADEWEEFLHAEDPSLAFLSFWVLKEAAAKCTGHGLQGFPDHTHFSLADPRIRRWDSCLYAIVTESSEEGETFYAL